MTALADVDRRQQLGQLLRAKKTWDRLVLMLAECRGLDCGALFLHQIEAELELHRVRFWQLADELGVPRDFSAADANRAARVLYARGEDTRE